MAPPRRGRKPWSASRRLSCGPDSLPDGTAEPRLEQMSFHKLG